MLLANYEFRVMVIYGSGLCVVNEYDWDMVRDAWAMAEGYVVGWLENWR